VLQQVHEDVGAGRGIGDDEVGACGIELLDILLVVGPGDDADVRMQMAAGQGQKDVGAVVVGGILNQAERGTHEFLR
jgi:hypothetical protein